MCGPPGSGKSTFARESGLPVFDRDDACWQSERQFIAALAALGRRPASQAAVIRTGATRSARARAADLIGATRVVVMDTPEDVCVRRIQERHRPHPPLAQQIAGCRAWFERFEPDLYPPPLAW